jgi:tetratricopeptide (TPR) repeat protein
MKTLRVLFILIGGSCYPMMGMTTVPDSLKSKIDSLIDLSRSSNIEERYVGEFGIAWELYDLDNPLAARYATRAYKSICEIADSARMLKAGRLLGQLLRRVDKPDSSVLMFETVLPLAVALRDSVEQAKVLNALSIVYTFQGRYDLALLNNLKSLDLWRALEDTVGMVIGFGNTGVTYYKMENWIEAERYYLDAINLHKHYPSHHLFTNMAVLKIRMGDTLAFKSWNERAVAEMSVEDRAIVCISYSFGYGWYYQTLKNYKLAIAYFQQALSGALLNDDFRMAAESRVKIAQCYADLGQFDDSMKVISGLEEDLATSKMDPIRLTCYDLLSTAFEKKGQMKEALFYRNRYQVLNDTFNGQRIMNRVLMARVKFDEEQNRLVHSQQREVISLSESVIARQQLVIILSVSLLVVLIGLGFVLIRFYRFQKQISKDLDKKVLERTLELERSEKELTSNLGQQHALMHMISARVQSSIATIRGLCTIRHFEAGDKLEHELEKVATNLTQVPQIIHRSLVSKADQKASNMTQQQRLNDASGIGHPSH